MGRAHGGDRLQERRPCEGQLGIRPAGDTLRVEPCIPTHWPGYEVGYRHGSATYRIRVENPAGAGRGVRSVHVDGQPVPGGVVPFRDDGRTHNVRVTLGHGESAAATQAPHSRQEDRLND